MKKQGNFANKDNHNIYMKTTFVIVLFRFSEAPWWIPLDFYTHGEINIYRRISWELKIDKANRDLNSQPESFRTVIGRTLSLFSVGTSFLAIKQSHFVFYQHSKNYFITFSFLFPVSQTFSGFFMEKEFPG